ncbi:MAG: nitroreductase family protein [Firmicutes bacterium]|nr:nitroreductase family protein [Bacillota bacterium]
MDFYKAVESRRTVRELKRDEVPQDAVERILGAALKAPSNNHLREWQFVVLRSSEEKETALQAVAEIAKAGKVSSAAAPAALAASGTELTPEVAAQKAMFGYAMPRQYTMLEKSGCLILPFFKAAPPFAKLLENDFPSGQRVSVNALNSFAAAWCMIENLFLAASAEGYACSMRIPVGEEMYKVCKAVGAPDGWVMPCYIGLGLPEDGAEKLPQVQPSLSDVMHPGKW